MSFGVKTPYCYIYIVNQTGDLRKGKYYANYANYVAQRKAFPTGGKAFGKLCDRRADQPSEPGSTLVGGWQWGQAL